MKAPRWAAWVAAAVCVPVVSLPWLISLSAPERMTETLLWIYPFAVFGGAYCAWKSMPERPEVYWILIAVILLIHAAMWMLADPTIVTRLAL